MFLGCFWPLTASMTLEVKKIVLMLQHKEF